jgi:hypothetical protein
MKHTHTDSDYYDYYHTKLYSTNKQQQPKPISERRSDESENLTGSPQKKKKEEHPNGVWTKNEDRERV